MSDMTPAVNGRFAPRFDLRGPVSYRGDGLDGQGTIWDISFSGARIEMVSSHPPQGTRLQLRPSLFPGSYETELTADVVRETHRGGFAVRFMNLDESQLRLLNRALPSSSSTQSP